ncbi:MAG: flavodoxin family protein [Desulfovibrio sp.]|nr:flavodoxin family protein [Desulfovibrio sp.]
MHESLVLSASPHAGGVTETAAAMLAKGMGSRSFSLLHLRDYRVHPCQGCGFCERSPHTCLLDRDGDDGEFLLQRIYAAHSVILCAPIYFYALPADCKALIDRAQRFWQSQALQEDRARRPSFVLLIAGRKKGDALFSGALHTLRYFLQAMGRELVATKTLRGLEKRTDLVNQPDLCHELEELGQKWLSAL